MDDERWKSDLKVLNKNVSLQAEVRDFKHSRGPPVRHMVSQFKGKENDDDSDDGDDDIVLYLVHLNPKVSRQQTNHGALSECIWI